MYVFLLKEKVAQELCFLQSDGCETTLGSLVGIVTTEVRHITQGLIQGTVQGLQPSASMH